MLHNIEMYRESLSVERRVLFDRYELVDNALKVVGVGSVGTTCGIALFFAAENDPLFIQVKEARQSVLEPYSTFKSDDTAGLRVVTGQRIMQSAHDIFLGHYVSLTGKHFYARQLRDVKVKPLVEIFTPQNMLGYARNCGWALARAHARSGDPAIIAGYIGKGKTFAKAIGNFADSYLDQNESDHKKLIEAIRKVSSKPPQLPIDEQRETNIMNIDQIPIGALFIITVVVVLLAIESGYRFAGFLRSRGKNENEAPVATMVGATLSLVAFMIAFTFGVAAQRFNERRVLIIEEASSIGSTYFCAELLPEANKKEVQACLREYVDLRVKNQPYAENGQQMLAESEKLQDRLMTQAVDRLQGQSKLSRYQVIHQFTE